MTSMDSKLQKFSPSSYGIYCVCVILRKPCFAHVLQNFISHLYPRVLNGSTYLTVAVLVVCTMKYITYTDHGGSCVCGINGVLSWTM